MIRSRDLVQWEDVGAAMVPIEAAPPFYWAPEVTYSDGRFYLYYSCGNEVNMELRVATSDRPDGGFVDSGVRLTSEQFAIDAHVFIDDDGQKYLFYATDFLSHSHIGTGTVVDRMVDWYQLEGNPRPVTRAKYDWQVYDPRRPEKGNVRWHTVEGPSVVKRRGRYFQMFSGGNWKNESYGVGYALSESLLNSEEWKQSIDGTTVLPILRSIDKVHGPGHNSLVLGPNNREQFCVYHSWVNDQRVMSIDRIDIVDDRMILLGPSISAQPSPFLPRSAPALEEFRSRGFEKVSSNFLVAATFRLAGGNDHMFFSITDGDGSRIAELNFSDGQAYLQSGVMSQSSVSLPVAHAFSEFQCVGIEVNGRTLRLRLNDLLWHEARIGDMAGDGRIQIAYSAGVDILNLDLTEGFVDLFEGESFVEGWSGLTDGTGLGGGHSSLMMTSEDGVAIAAKGSSFDNFEFAVNLRDVSGSGFGFVLLSSEDETEMLFDLSNTETGLLAIGNGVRKEVVRLPEDLSASWYRQFRFIKQDGSITIDAEGANLGRYQVSSDPSRIGIVTNGSVAVEMVRATRLGS